MVLERLSKQGAAVAGSGAGGFAGGFFSSPTFIILGALVVGLLFFAGDIRKALGSLGENFGKVELPDITLPTINFPEITFPEFNFPEITFPDFPDFSFLEGIFGFGPPPPPTPPPPGTTPSEELGPITTPEGCTVDDQGIIRCPTPPTFDVCEVAPELCEPCGPGETRIGGICQPSDEPVTPPITPPTPPGPELPPGFTGGGPSFEGGSIFETNDCFLSLSQLIDKYGVSASQAANIKAIACTAEPGEQPTDIPEEFDFGTSTGSGLLPGEEQIVTGGATLESEAKRGACLSCELFGLNCGICRGEI